MRDCDKGTGCWQVPALAPITSYVHVDAGLWINNGTVFLDDRPPTALDDLSWDYHGCDDHYQIGIQSANGTTVPNWVLEWTGTSTG